MSIVDDVFGQVFVGRKRRRGHRKEPLQKRVKRLRMEQLEPRTLLSATAICGSPAPGLYESVAPAALAGAHQYGGAAAPAVAVAAVPAAPSFTATASSTSQINLAWTPVPGATSYLVDRWINDAWQQIGSVGSNVTTFPVTGLNAGTTYYFSVGARNAEGLTWATHWQSATTHPAAPSFTATASSASQIHLAWNSVSSATSYVVDRKVNGVWRHIANLDSGRTSFDVSGLSAATVYRFKVGASNSPATTWANPVGATTLARVPSSFTAKTVSSSRIDLTWKGVSGANNYLINEWINGAWRQIASVGSARTSFSVTGLAAGAAYSFEVGAHNAGGTNWTAARSATTRVAAPAFQATPYSSSQVNLTWNRVSGAAGYVVKQFVNGGWRKIATGDSNSVGCAVRDLKAATAYSFKVAAFNAGGAAWAKVKKATTGLLVRHPVAAAPYSVASGTLFGARGPSHLDVQQGAVGDCWLLASFAAVAARNPTSIRSMFSAAGRTVEDGVMVNLYKVRFFNSAGVARYFTVDAQLPWGNRGGYYAHPVNNVLWVALAEKAYIAASAARYVTASHQGTLRYTALESGQPRWALQAITGKAAGSYGINPTNVAAAWNAGKYVVLTSRNNPADPYIVGDSASTHAYAVVAYVPSTNTPYHVYNPWGVDSSGYLSNGLFHGHPVYGLIFGNAGFLSQNFQEQAFGVRTAVGVDREMRRAYETATDVLLAEWVYSRDNDDRDAADGEGSCWN